MVSVAKKLLGYGVEIEELIKAGNEELEKAIDKYNLFIADKSDLTPSTYYVWWIRFGVIREIVDKKFPTLGISIKKALEEKDFDSYYVYFFLEFILINLIQYKEGGSKDALAILENSLMSTFGDPKLKNRISDKNFIREIPEFMEILKEVNPNIFQKLE